MGYVRYSAVRLTLLAALAITGGRADAAGSSGTLVPTGVHLESGNDYIFGQFQNPDQCSTNGVVLLQPANAEELDRMISMALTAAASGKKISMWLIGCAPVPWHPSAPRAVSMGFAG